MTRMVKRIQKTNLKSLGFTFQDMRRATSFPGESPWERGCEAQWPLVDSGSNGPDKSPGLDIFLCSWPGHFVLTVPFSAGLYKWVPRNLILEPCDGVQKPEIGDGLMDCLAQCKLYQAV